jgi:hypothetical protein
MSECFINTGIDLAFKLVLMNGKLPVSTIARILDFNLQYTERLLGILERKKMIKMNYRLFGETEVMVNNGHEEVFHGMKKMKVFDWMIHCPEKERGVMFRVSCQNCKHFQDIEGKIVNEKGNFDFRPESVVCGWKEKADAM